MYELHYSDSACTILSNTKAIGNYSSTCHNTEEVATAASSYQGFCYLGSEVLAPMDSFMHSYYDSDTTCDNTSVPVEYHLYATDLCVDVTRMLDNKYQESRYSTCSSKCK